MKKIFTLLAGLLLIVSCSDQQQPVSSNDSTSIKADSITTTDSNGAMHSQVIEMNKSLCDIADFISGRIHFNNATLHDSLMSNPDRKKYAASADKKWKQYDSIRMQQLKKWSREELSFLQSKSFNAFYPFSGPDALHAGLFFPNADTIMMIGLEPVGSVPFLDSLPDDTLSNYFSSLNNSLYAILNFSFFRTKAMKKDLKSEEVNGTTPLILIFLNRLGYKLSDVTPVEIDKNGQLIKRDRKTKGIPGMQYTYTDSSQTKKHVLFYFSCDISDPGLERNIFFYNYLARQKPYFTYLKSASYLMHYKSFSKIRDLILKNSIGVLQDDSGIPHHFFENEKWKYQLYGNYTGVINLFKSEYQNDLDSLYKVPQQKIKPLNFGIGYKWHKGESNLVLYQKLK